MLGKLIKHELKAQYKTFIILYIAAAFLNIVLKIYNAFTKNLEEIKLAQLFEASLNMLVVFVSIALFIATFAISISRFYNSMMKDEGYLTHTLPVPTWMLILSKFLVFIIWMVADVILHYFIIALHSGSLLWISDCSREFSKGMAIGLEATNISVADAKQFLILTAILFALYSLLFMAKVYFSFSIGQLSNKNKLLWSIVVFFGVTIALQILGMILAVSLFPNNQTMMTDAEGIIFAINAMKYSLVIDLITAVALYIGANVLFTKKLNLD